MKMNRVSGINKYLTLKENSSMKQAAVSDFDALAAKSPRQTRDVSRTTRWLAPVLLCFQVCAQSSPFHLGFPIHHASGGEVNPYSAPIITVVDHYANGFYATDKNPLTIQAYTGEQGSWLTTSQPQCGPSGSPCGQYNFNFLPPHNGESSLRFYVNGFYTGTTLDAPYSTEVLNYRGHPGTDFAYSLGTTVYAAHDGYLFVPKNDPINGPPTNFNTFYILDASGWSTWYLHTIPGSITATFPCPTKLLPDGDTCVGGVQRGDPVATVGHQGVCCAHLHFEVRAACDFGSQVLSGCKVADPYGWEWITPDPLGTNNATQAMTSLVPLWDLATWNVVQPQVTKAVASTSANTWTITISGINFDGANISNNVITLWNRVGFYCFACGGTGSPATVTVQSATNTQIIAQVEITDTSIAFSPDVAVVKVASAPNGVGPRSLGQALSLTAATPSSFSLLLYKTPAPGGGVFLGFGGFHSATDGGQVVFNSGVDINGDNVPDLYPDFLSNASGISEVAFAGFSTISNTVIDNSGDLSFAGITKPGSAAAVYFVPVGSSTPTTIAKAGDLCPAPCPVSGSPFFLGVSGPFAISESGEVVFSAELQGTQPTPTWILYIYSPSTQAFTKIAADGLGGDLTPLGGHFSSQNLFGSVGINPTSGDVVFSDLVTGGASAGAIFRFSRSSGTLSKLIAQGDLAPPGITGTIGVPIGSLGGQNLVFYSSVTGGASAQVIGVIPNIGAASPQVILVAYQGEATGTVAGGTFDAAGYPDLPFATYGEGPGAPAVRKDGSVVFASALLGASSSTGASTDQGLFLWNGATITKVVVDNDQLSNGYTLHGVLQFSIDNIGDIWYFATSEN
jgi:Peptidase family M23